MTGREPGHDRRFGRSCRSSSGQPDMAGPLRPSPSSSLGPSSGSAPTASFSPGASGRRGRRPHPSSLPEREDEEEAFVDPSEDLRG